MLRKLSSRSLLILVLSLSMSQARCVSDILNDVGVPLPGSVNAATLRAAVSETAFSAFITGVITYCADYSGLCNQADSEIFSAALLSKNITPDNLPIQDRQWFSASRAAKCQDNVSEAMQTQVYIYLKTNEVAGDSSTGAESVTPKGLRDSLPGAAVFSASAAEDCLDS